MNNFEFLIMERVVRKGQPFFIFFNLGLIAKNQKDSLQYSSINFLQRSLESPE